MQTVTAAVEAMKVSHTRAADVILKASQISAADVEGIGEALSKTGIISICGGFIYRANFGYYVWSYTSNTRRVHLP